MSRNLAIAIAIAIVLVAALVFGVVLLTLAGCSVAAPTPPPAPGPPAVAEAEMALGASSPDGGAGDGGAMVPLTDGQDVLLVAGAQGGFHVWLRWGVRDLPAGTMTLERTAHRASDGAVVLRFDSRIDIGAAGSDGWFAPAAPIPMFMCPSPIGISIVDEPIQFQLRVIDDAGTERARGGITLVPRCPAAQRDFCTRICTG